jgi:protein CLEC16A
VLQHQVILFCIGETFTDQPPIYPPIDLPVNNRANAANFSGLPKPGVEVNLGLISLLGTLLWHYEKCNVS